MSCCPKQAYICPWEFWNCLKSWKVKYVCPSIANPWHWQRPLLCGENLIPASPAWKRIQIFILLNGARKSGQNSEEKELKRKNSMKKDSDIHALKRREEKLKEFSELAICKTTLESLQHVIICTPMKICRYVFDQFFNGDNSWNWVSKPLILSPRIRDSYCVTETRANTLSNG